MLRLNDLVESGGNSRHLLQRSACTVNRCGYPEEPACPDFDKWRVFYVPKNTKFVEDPSGKRPETFSGTGRGPRPIINTARLSELEEAPKKEV